MADFVVQNFGAAAGDGVEAGVTQARDGGTEVDLAVLGDSEDFAGGEAMEPDLREALLDAAEERLEPVDLEVRVDAALHQHTSAAHLNRLADLVVDGVEVEDVAFGGELALQRPVEGAEGAVLGAEVGVVDVAVNDVADHAFGVEASADRVGFHTDADEVVGGEAVQSLLAGNAQGPILRRLFFRGHDTLITMHDLTPEDQFIPLHNAVDTANFLWPEFVRVHGCFFRAIHSGSNAPPPSDTATDWESFVNHTHILDEFSTGPVKAHTYL